MNIEEEKLKRIKMWLDGKKANPFKLILFPTARCNLSCVFCKGALNRNIKGNATELTKKEWIEIVKWGIKKGVKEWWVTGGGEPLVKKETAMAMLKLIKKSGAYCEFMTNGTLFTEKLVKEFVKLEVDKVLISLDCSDSEINNALRGKDSFKRVLQTLEFFKKFKERGKKPIIQVSSVINNKNYLKIQDLIRLTKEKADELELHQLIVYPDTFNNVKNLLLDKEQEKKLEKELEKATKLAKSLNLKFDAEALKEAKAVSNNKEKIEAKRSLPLCFEPFYTMLVDMNGGIVPCCPAGAKDEKPNLKQESLNNIWFGSYFSEFRRRMRKRIPFDICLNCGVINLTKSLQKRF